MREGQRELMKEYNDRISKAEDKELELFKVVQKEQRLFFKILDTIFLFLILGGMVYAYLHGVYDKTEVTIDCNGVITETNNFGKFPTGKMLLPNLTVVDKPEVFSVDNSD